MDNNIIKQGKIYKIDIFNSIILIYKIENIKNEVVVHLSLNNIEYNDGEIYEIGHIPINLKNLNFNIIKEFKENTFETQDVDEGYNYWLNTDQANRGYWNIDLKEIIENTLDLKE
jgi:hypothetical protein